jgi:hypothetical protein
MLAKKELKLRFLIQDYKPFTVLQSEVTRWKDYKLH